MTRVRLEAADLVVDVDAPRCGLDTVLTAAVTLLTEVAGAATARTPPPPAAVGFQTDLDPTPPHPGTLTTDLPAIDPPDWGHTP
jgi:hypothetical protein